MVQVQNLVLSLRHVLSVAVKVRLFTHSSHFLAWFVMSSLVRTVTAQVRLIRKYLTVMGKLYQHKKTIKFTIPAGIDNGQSVRIQGKGEPGVNVGPRGDLLVTVMISADPEFKRWI